ncbi:MAG: hypothetical protein Q7W02_02495 [Candidatus Rokubacteria bacterium]|nr:hypothetical protein [Candidatus Rokubacteria bacterium]
MTTGLQLLNTPRGARFLVAAVQRRVGETPEQRLRWIMDFLRLDLDLLTSGEVEAKGDDLRMIAAHSLPRGVGLKTTVSPMAAGVLRRYRDQIHEGLRSVLGKDCQWPLSGRPVLERRAGGFRIVVDGDEMVGILSGIAQLIVEAGDRLRACQDPACGTPFVATKRQAYCTTKHSQRVRNQKRIQKEKATMARGKP